MDNNRQRIYIANSGLNRVEIYDIRQRQMLTPLKVGQLPRSLAITPDGSTMYVANSGGESISVVDLDSMKLTGRIKFPPLPFNSAAAVVTPSVIAASQRGLQIVMNNGTIWQVVCERSCAASCQPGHRNQHRHGSKNDGGDAGRRIYSAACRKRFSLSLRCTCG